MSLADEKRVNLTATSSLVNRTHRVVRERARTMEAHRKTMRELILPMVVCAGLLAGVVFAIWTLLDEYNIVPTGLPDASQQIFVLMIWCLPISAAVLGMLLLRRTGGKSDGTRPDHGSAR